MPIECLIIGILQESPQKDGPEQLAMLQKISQQQQESVTISCCVGNMDAFGNAFERVQRQTEELSRINVNNAKTIANTARETVSEFSVNRERETQNL